MSVPQVPPVAATRAEMLLVRYGELALKGRNRRQFEEALVRNLRAAAGGPLRVERRRGRLAVLPAQDGAGVVELASRLRDVFGVHSLSLARGAPKEPEAIAEVAREVLAEALASLPPDRPVTFRVQSSRADKSFPLHSCDLDRFVADRVLGDPRLQVRMKGAELVLGIDVRDERAYVFAGRLAGPGGLPVGTQGRAVCLLSGGLDSPVAAWMAMKRGCEVSFATFHSWPYIGDASRKKVVDVARRLARWQPRTRLWVVPFTETQVAVRDAAPAPYRTVLYRRMMQRIATGLARRRRALALVTGESLGQVASQTVENMTCIAAATDLLVLRPLVSMDKEEIVRLARHIGTFELSARPEPDCCTVFMPQNPVIRGRVEECERVEAALDVEGLVARALEGVEQLDL